MACTVAVLSLAGGIGSTTATLTILNAIFFKAPPLYRQPAELSRVSISTPEERRGPVPGALFAAWSADRDSRAEIAAATESRPVDLRTGDRTTTTHLRRVTPTLFSVLGVDPRLGRTFSPGDAVGTASQPVVLSHRVWQNVFYERADTVGATVLVDGRPHEVVGIMPQRFWFRTMDAEIWTPLRTAELTTTSLEVVVRRPHGMSAEALADRLQRHASEFGRSLPGDERRLRVLVSKVRGTPLGEMVALIIPPLVVLAVLLTLLIACANVAILMFARWTAREHDIALRSALGASRARLIGLLLTESSIIAALGGLLGVWATFALRRVALRNVPDAAFFDMTIDSGILLQAAIVSILTGVLSGIGPALIETRRLATNPLRLIASSDRVRQRWRHALVVLEISVTVALLVVAGTQVDAYRRMVAGNMGFATGPLLTARIEHPSGVDMGLVLSRVAGIPGVGGVAAGTDVPMAVGPMRQRVSAHSDRSGEVVALRAAITPEFFAVLDVPLRAGRSFGTEDIADSSRVVIVNELLARRVWPRGDAIGSHLWIDNVPHTIIGIVANYARFVLHPPHLGFYVPLTAQRSGGTHLQLLVRAAGDPRPLVTTVRREIAALGHGYAVTRASAFSQMIEGGSREVLELTYAMSPLMGMGLFLTATGIFGVLAFAVARRSKELALRVAIGAGPRDLVRLVTAHSLRLTAAGAFIGVSLTFVLTRLARAAGGAGSAFDTPSWPAFAVPVAIVAVVVALATWLPARRALKINPALLLRAE